MSRWNETLQTQQGVHFEETLTNVISPIVPSVYNTVQVNSHDYGCVLRAFESLLAAHENFDWIISFTHALGKSFTIVKARNFHITVSGSSWTVEEKFYTAPGSRTNIFCQSHFLKPVSNRAKQSDSSLSAETLERIFTPTAYSTTRQLRNAVEIKYFTIKKTW